MKYVCMEDIENMAAQGIKQLILDENTVLMDFARDMAHQLGITIIDGTRPNPIMAANTATPSSPARAATPAATAPTSAPRAAPAPSTQAVAPAFGGKPKGCQHGPITLTTRPAPSKNHQEDDGVVDQLIELVRQSTGKRPGN